MVIFGDLLVGRSKLIQKYIQNMDQHLVKLATHDKHLLSDYMVDPEYFSTCGEIEHVQ